MDVLPSLPARLAKEQMELSRRWASLGDAACRPPRGAALTVVSCLRKRPGGREEEPRGGYVNTGSPRECVSASRRQQTAPPAPAEGKCGGKRRSVSS
ncbi:hypothetical protein SKAU_G00147550 [Synaphobranchus kaupii]|uniref:Uncharacterized protein n=1 Tax=Synaphobranchus kaupii TaxID=118154 RepID=A0A9Q1FTU8_SYNKA|nr:hypothetical protein SKAU_G00147550 [Synaphobranchus kaupii]